MASLMLMIFVMQLVFQLVNIIGASTINDFLWTLYQNLPGRPLKQDARRQVELQREVLKLKREMQATSSQDEFARWAKIRRQHDKRENEYDATSQSLKASQTQFQSYATIIRITCTFGLRTVILFWYGKQPMYWIPRGWVPGYVEWLLAFPKAPTGSVSIVTWDLACQCVILMVKRAVGATWMLAMDGKMGGTPPDEQSENRGGRAEEKKEI